MARGRPRPDSAPRPTPCSKRRAGRSAARGRLKIFLGAAPGVGKTYEMLHAARARQGREGVDVVVGVVETHGRAETEALLDGLEVIPRRRVDYNGRCSRRWTSTRSSPAGRGLALVDELAHTNAPGSRHPKRYQDVEELLDAGIDVYTTLNIQHVESLNDVVAQITRIRVRETVPDSVLDRADDIELIDLTPDDLIQRLQRGQGLRPEQAERALRHYFSRGNLTALRELALRRTAERVDDAAAQPHAGPRDRRAVGGGRALLVCVSEDPRAAASCATPSAWPTGCTRPGPRSTSRGRRSLPSARPSATARRDPAAGRAARRRGGHAFPGERRIADDILAFARANNVTHIVVGKSERSRWFELLHGSVVHDLVRSARRHQRPRHRRRGDGGRASRAGAVDGCAGAARVDPRPYLLRARSPCAAALGRRPAARPCLGVENVALVFLTAVVASRCATGWGRRSGRGALPSLCLQLLLPAAALHLHDRRPDERRGLRLLHVRGGARLEPRGARRAPDRGRRRRGRAPTERLYGFSRKLAGCGTLDDLLWAIASQIAAMLKVRVVLLLPEDGPSPSGPAIRPRTRSTRPTSPPRTGPGTTTGRPGAAPTPCPAASACSCRCAPAAAPRA